MILLDTNILSEIMKAEPDARVVAWLDDQPATSLFVSAVTRAEIELGIALLPEGRRKEAIITASRTMFEEFSGRCLAFGERAAVHYGQLVAERTKKGRPITVEDAQIASIALVHGLHLATRNTRDFEGIPKLLLIDPWT
ncbi:MAG: type II toxin-antitoxin system VapC family toxin [Trueperaceae bacterium]|nr:MAG: type II toxin-antitoxin system VapC family toxin [Trueperaceae bacterium]